MFLEKFADDKTLCMLLKELGNLKMGYKERVKYFNQKFTLLLNKFPIVVQPHDDITKGYYTTTLPTNISMFFKRVMKDTLALNFEEALVFEKYLHSIGVIEHNDDPNDSKETFKKTQPSSGKSKEKDSFDMEILTKSLKLLTNEI